MREFLTAQNPRINLCNVLYIFFVISLICLNVYGQSEPAYKLEVRIKMIQGPENWCANNAPQCSVDKLYFPSGAEYDLSLQNGPYDEKKITIPLDERPESFKYYAQTCEKCGPAHSIKYESDEHAVKSIVWDSNNSFYWERPVGGDCNANRKTIFYFYFLLTPCTKLGLSGVNVSGLSPVMKKTSHSYTFNYTAPEGLSVRALQWQLDGVNYNGEVPPPSVDIDFTNITPGKHVLRAIPKFAETTNPCLLIEEGNHTKEIDVLPTCINDNGRLVIEGAGITYLPNVNGYRVPENGNTGSSVPITVRLEGVTDPDENYTWIPYSFPGGEGITVTPPFSDANPRYAGSKTFTVVLHEMQKYPISGYGMYCHGYSANLFFKGQDRIFKQKCKMIIPDDLVSLLRDHYQEDIKDVTELIQTGVLSSFSWTLESQKGIIVRPGMKLVNGAKLVLKRADPTEDPGNKDKNINYTRMISYHDDGTPAGESIQYFDDEGKPLQSQTKSFTNRIILGSQMVYDNFGRAVITTLPAPVYATTGVFNDCDGNNEDLVFAYKENFISNTGAISYTNFTEPVANTEPGTLGWYYSDNNNAASTSKLKEPYIPASGYPYSRVTFWEDGTDEVKNSAEPGEALRIGSGHEAESKTLAVQATDEVLTHYLQFRGEVLEHEGVTSLFEKAVRSTARDQNGIEAESWSDAGGNVLVTRHKGEPESFAYNYYDEAGRLVCSISPNGVKQLKDGRSWHDVDKTTYKYNHQGWLLEINEFDAGTTRYMYRKDGTIRFSQNADQAKSKKYSYTNYDRAGRLVESGEYSPYEGENETGPLFNSPELKSILEDRTQNGGFTNGIKSDVLLTQYDIPIEGSRRNQRFVRGKVSYTEKPQVSKTWYSYDERGRVTWMVQDIEGLGIKTLDYEYDKTGGVSKVVYQIDREDQFVHFYKYDLDSRLSEVYADQDDLQESQLPADKLRARYHYYLHGPLKRVELGKDVQGIDYVYTIQGWLKSINHPDPVKDPGKDDEDINNFSKDAFGMTLEYFAGDYIKGQSGISSFELEEMSDYKDHYNGNIKAITWRTQNTQDQDNPRSVYAYKYTDNYQLKSGDFGRYGNGNYYINGNKNKETNITYDLNGNIITLDRYRNSGSLMNKLNYKYYQTSSGVTTNQLKEVRDQNSLYRSYTYNDIGQMIEQTEAQTDKKLKVTYNVSGNVTEVRDENDHLKVSFTYNDKEQRIKKSTYDNDGNISYSTWYVYDASGNVMSIYNQNQNASTPQQIEIPVYGSGRLGTYDRSKYMYELTDHLGNVRALVSKGGERANTINWADYYPFGLLNNDLQKSNFSYRYGYQGKFAEKENETGWNIFELRMYDPVIGRWTSGDPKRVGYSPYVGMGNNPVIGTDPDGGSPESTHTDGNGNVLAVYNDGDLGVYKHEGATTKSDINKYYSSTNTSAGGVKMGESLHMFSFVDHQAYNESGGKNLIGTGKIDFNSTWAYNQVDGILSQSPSALNYALKARGGHIWDIKTHTPNGKSTYGSIIGHGRKHMNIYASARDAGNFAAGAVMARSYIPNFVIMNGFGAYNLSGNNAFAAFGIYFPNFFNPMYGRGEDPLSYMGIQAGKNNHINYFWNSVFK